MGCGTSSSRIEEVPPDVHSPRRTPSTVAAPAAVASSPQASLVAAAHGEGGESSPTHKAGSTPVSPKGADAKSPLSSPKRPSVIVLDAGSHVRGRKSFDARPAARPLRIPRGVTAYISKSEWQCGGCNFINENASVCSICGISKQEAAKLLSEGIANAPTGGVWEATHGLHTTLKLKCSSLNVHDDFGAFVCCFWGVWGNPYIATVVLLSHKN
jgi:hypothetical protein